MLNTRSEAFFNLVATKISVRPRKNTVEGEEVGYTHPVCPPGGEAPEHSRSQKLDTIVCLY